MAISQIRAPLPGMLYHKPMPEQPPYKSPGDGVKAGDVLGLIEVMKSFHEVKSDVDGTFKAYLVENEDAVMAGQPLAEIDT